MKKLYYVALALSKKEDIDFKEAYRRVKIRDYYVRKWSKEKTASVSK